jgi:hypothetical protein
MIESLRAFARVDDLAESLELSVAVAAEPDAEDQATFAQVIERDRLAGDLVNAATGKGRDERAEPQPLGARRDRG